MCRHCSILALGKGSWWRPWMCWTFQRTGNFPGERWSSTQRLPYVCQKRIRGQFCSPSSKLWSMHTIEVYYSQLFVLLHVPRALDANEKCQTTRRGLQPASPSPPWLDQHVMGESNCAVCVGLWQSGDHTKYNTSYIEWRTGFMDFTFILQCACSNSSVYYARSGKSSPPRYPWNAVQDVDDEEFHSIQKKGSCAATQLTSWGSLCLIRLTCGIFSFGDTQSMGRRAFPNSSVSIWYPFDCGEGLF